MSYLSILFLCKLNYMPTLHYEFLFLQFLALVPILFSQSSFEGIELFQATQSILFLPQCFISFHAIVSHDHRFPSYVFINLSFLSDLLLNKLFFVGVVPVDRVGLELLFVYAVISLPILHIHHFYLHLSLFSLLFWNQLFFETMVSVHRFGFELLFD